MNNHSIFLFITFILLFNQTLQERDDPIYFYPEMILSWYKDMEVDMKDVDLVEGTQYTFGFALSKTLPVLMCRKAWKFSKTQRMQYTNINGNVCSEFASGSNYYFAIAGSCIGSFCSADIFNFSTVKVVEEDAYQSFMLNHFKVDGVNYMFPEYEFEDDFINKYSYLDIRYSLDNKAFTKVEWNMEDNKDLVNILPKLTVGSVVSIVIFDKDRLIVFAAKECNVVNYPNIITSRYHVAKGYGHKIRFTFDTPGMEAFKIVLKSGNIIIAQKASDSNVNYLDVNVDDPLIQTGNHTITYTYTHKLEKTDTSKFLINIYDDANKDIFTFNNDYSPCHYQKTEANVFTGYLRSDVKIVPESPLTITASISKGNSNSLTNIITNQDETDPHLFTFSLEAGTLNAIGDIHIYIYENNDHTYPLYSNIITVTKPTILTPFQTYYKDKQGTLTFTDLTCPLQNIILTSLTNSSEVVTVNCIMNTNNVITCPYTLLRGYDTFDISVDGYHIANIDLMREIQSATFITETPHCYLLNKDNKIKIKSDEYNFKYLKYLTIKNGDTRITVNTTSNGIIYNYNNIKNEIGLTVYTDTPGIFTVDYLTDVNDDNSTFKFMDVFAVVETHFQLEKSCLFKSNYFDYFNVILNFDLNLNPSDYVDVVYLDDANVTCVSNTNIGKSKLNCTFDFPTLSAPRDFKIKLKCSDDFYTSSQTFSVYRYELISNIDDSDNVCQTKDVNVNDVKMRIYSASSLSNETNFNIKLRQK